jgi:hypothetical protein
MDKTITISPKERIKTKLATPCIVCGESIPLEAYEEEAYLHGFYVHNKICEKCKAAILYVREQMI